MPGRRRTLRWAFPTRGPSRPWWPQLTAPIPIFMIPPDIGAIPMHLEDYLDIQTPDVIRLKGHRIGLEQVIERYHEGYSAEEMTQEFPGLELALVYAAITYYLLNRAEMDAYLARVNAAVTARMETDDAQPAPPVVQRLRALRAARNESAA